PATITPRRERARDAVESLQGTALGAVETPRDQAGVATEPPRAPAPIAAAESRAKSDERKALLQKEADPSDARLSARQAPAVAPPSAVAQGYVHTSSGLRARLAVGERTAAESTVRDLVARAGGQVLSQGTDGDAAVLRLIVAADRWDELRRGLEAFGTLRVEGQKAEGASQLRVPLRLER